MAWQEEIVFSKIIEENLVTLRTLALSILTIALWACPGAAQHPGVPEPVEALCPADGLEREFEFSTDPTFAVIEVRHHSRTIAAMLTHTIYADGRFVYRWVTNGGLIAEEREYAVPYEELQELVGRAVAAGLMDYDAERIEAEKGTDRTRVFNNADSGAVEFIFSLEKYRGPRMAAAEEWRVSIQEESLRTLARFYPEIAEIQCLHAVTKQLHSYKKMAQEKEYEKE